ncbi:hypothetical protein ACFFGT_18585 [Mucilaginibacter angelicae]|uniref:Uncharacterized protein n=1 Tax=Mucilaginibacter angelicae TaxID=869718 RepID=A0ABV6L9U4_9SPHI
MMFVTSIIAADFFSRGGAKICFTSKDFMVGKFALGMGADTGLWLMPVQYERTARAAGNAIIDFEYRIFDFGISEIEFLRINELPELEKEQIL